MTATRYLFQVTFAATLGGFLFGYDWVVIGGARPFYEASFGIAKTGQEWVAGWAASSAIVGCLAGVLVVAPAADRFGRRPVLALSAILFFISAIGTALASSVISFSLFRIVGGIGIGLTSSLSPIYISEVAPTSRRGQLVALNQLAIVVGILAAQLTNLMIYHLDPARDNVGVELSTSWCGTYGWRWMLAMEAIPAGLFLVCCYWIPESPRWLVRHSRSSSLRERMPRARRDFHDRIIADSNLDATDGSASPVRSAAQGRLVFMGAVLAVIQQWCGINVIFYYADEVLLAAGFSLSSVMFNIVLTGAVNLVFTLIAIYAIDRWGRRFMLLLGTGGLAICLSLLGIGFQFGLQGNWLMILLLISIAIYAMTLAPVTWVVLSEIFPANRRATSMSHCVAALWASNFLLTLSFKPINHILEAGGSFLLFALICLLGMVFVGWTIPETKGRSLEQIETQLAGE